MKTKHYDKYYVKRNPSTGDVESDNGKPVLGELAKADCPLEERHAIILNKGWQMSGVFFVEREEEIEVDVNEKSQERLTLEKEANELGIKFRENIGDEKLKLKIQQKKEE